MVAAPTPTELQAAVAALRRGDVIGLPTETVYGLAADAGNVEAGVGNICNCLEQRLIIRSLA